MCETCLWKSDMAATVTGARSREIKKQNYQYFLVLDFEGNCNEQKTIPMEIIEFPILKVNAETFDVETTFHQYVEPLNDITKLTTGITGITADMVKGKPDLEKTLELVDEWMDENLIREGATFIFVTCGDWDLKTQLPQETKRRNIPLKNYFRQWINIKRPFQEVTGKKGYGMKHMLDQLNLSLDGKHHSGIDDTRNIAKIVKELALMGYIYSETGNSWGKKKH